MIALNGAHYPTDLRHGSTLHDPAGTDELECVGEVNILVIDDEPTICTVVRDALMRRDFKVHAISDMTRVEAAVKQRNHFHLIVIDYFLDTLPIEQAFAWLKEYQPDAPIIVITGRPSFESAHASLRAHVHDYVTKPFQMSYLRQTVMRCLQTKGLLRMSEEAVRESLGAVLRDRRKAQSLTLNDVAKRTGISLGYLSQIELGKNSASIDTLYRICLALGLKLSDLFASVERA